MAEAGFRVFVPEPLNSDAYAVLTGVATVVDGRWDHPYGEAELARIAADFDALVITSREAVSRQVLEAAPRLKAIGKAGARPSNVDFAAAAERGVRVLWTPAANAVSVAESTVGLALALAKRLGEQVERLRQGGWREHSLLGIELAGRTAGLIGLGAIGRRVARRLAGFEMRLLACDPYAADDVFVELGVERRDLQGLLTAADVVSVHCTLDDRTRGLLGEADLRSMRPDAILINTARGPIVQEAALVAALREGWFRAAAIDVFDVEPLPARHALRSLPNLLATPHIAAFTAEAIRRESFWAMEDVRQVLLGRPPVHSPAMD